MGNLDANLHVALACGGTGGHIFPGLATAEVLHARGHTVTLWLAGKDIESKAVENTPWRKITIHAKGWEGGIRQLPRFAWTFMRARRNALRAMSLDVPDVILAMGSYAGMGPVAAALNLKVPVVLHEANSVPGRMVSFYAGRATRVAATFEATRHELKNKARLHMTGLPLRKDLAEASHFIRRPREADEPFRILCMGGSRGARALNQIVRRAARELATRKRNFFITHLTGRDDEEMVRATYEQAGVPHRVAAFDPDMARVYLETDLAICRAGASTCAELSAFGIPSLFVPYPHAAKNHQMANADEFFRLKAADIIPEQDLEVGWLTDYFDGCMHSPERLQRLSANIRTWGRADAAERLASLVEEAAAQG